MKNQNDQSENQLIAISMGDPSGVGPEILAKTAERYLAGNTEQKRVILLAVGDRTVLERAASIVNVDLPIKAIESGNLGLLRHGSHSFFPIIDLHNVASENFSFGALRAEYGRAAYESLVAAIDLALDGSVDAIVTNPLNKEALHLAGFKYGGHTEILAERTGAADYAMMLAHASVRVAHVSTHVSLRSACERVTVERVYRVIELLNEALVRIGVEGGRIAVAGLNPHAGEHGLFGDEEIAAIIPAIKRAQEIGIEASGPYPPDTLFPQLVGGVFDSAVVMYHDQGHIPVKLLGFRHAGESGFSDVEGVNITLGLPIIRTSVDHGTAFDIAGTGRASTGSLEMAIEYARSLIGSVADGSRKSR